MTSRILIRPKRARYYRCDLYHRAMQINGGGVLAAVTAVLIGVGFGYIVTRPSSGSGVLQSVADSDTVPISEQVEPYNFLAPEFLDGTLWQLSTIDGEPASGFMRFTQLEADLEITFGDDCTQSLALLEPVEGGLSIGPIRTGQTQCPTEEQTLEVYFEKGLVEVFGSTITITSPDGLVAGNLWESVSETGPFVEGSARG